LTGETGLPLLADSLSDCLPVFLYLLYVNYCAVPEFVRQIFVACTCRCLCILCEIYINVVIGLYRLFATNVLEIVMKMVQLQT